MLTSYSYMCGDFLYPLFYIESTKRGGDEFTLNDIIKELLNDQINKEFESAYLYFDFSNYFQAVGLEGYAHYYEIQAKEEIYHAMLIYKYMHYNNEKVKLMVINTNNIKPNSIKDALEISLKTEEKISNSINRIYDEANKLNDNRTKVFLSWFIEEQMEEESEARTMIDDYDLFNNDSGLFYLDDKYSKREYSKTNMEVI